MFRPRFFEMAVVALAVQVAGAAPAVEDPLARAAFDKEIALEMKDADVVDVFRQLAAVSGVPFSLEFESDPSLTLSFSAKNMSIRAVLASIAHTYELKYESLGDPIAVRPTGSKPVPRPAARPVSVSPANRPPVYRFKFEVRGAGGRLVLSSPEVATQLKAPLEIKQGVESRTAAGATSRAFLTFKVTPKADLGDSLELLVEVTEERAVNESRTITDRTADTKVAGKGETRLFESEDHQLVLMSWDLEPQLLPSAAESVYELKLEIRPPCGEPVLLGPMVASVGKAATFSRLVRATPSCDRQHPAVKTFDELMTFKLSPRGETAEGLSLSVDAKVERQPARGRDHSSRNTNVAKGNAVLYKSSAGNELVLTGWGVFEQAASKP